MKISRTILRLAAPLLVIAPANAAPIVVHVNVTGDVYPEFSGSPPSPYPTFVADLVFSFNNGASVGPTTAGLTVNSFTLPAADYPLSFGYDVDHDSITFGDTIYAVGNGFMCSITANHDDFCGRFLNVSTAPTVDFLDFSVAGVQNTDYLVRVATEPTSGVPEPAGWAMMIAGFALAGGAMRRRTSRIAYVFA